MAHAIAAGGGGETRTVAGKGNRIEQLEFVRGAASLIVVFWHTTLAFYPERTGIFPSLGSEKSLSGTLLFSLINGSASVMLFFVLSGYVLTYSLFRTGSTETLIRIAQRRLPRLAFLTTIVCVLSWLMLQSGLYQNVEAGQLSQSIWLTGLGFTNQPYIDHIDHSLTLWDAVKQGAVWTFFRGDSYLNSSMWTMRFELIGSYVAICSALLIFNVSSKIWRYFFLAAIAFFLSVSNNSQIICFLVGVLIAEIHYSYRPKIGNIMAVFAIIFALYLYGYNGSATKTFMPIYLVAKRINPSYISIISATIIISICLFNPSASRLLSGSWARFLGWISFPLYLIHLPVIFSVGSGIYLAASAEVAFLATVAVSILTAIGLAMLNDRWMVILSVMPLGRTAGHKVSSGDGSTNVNSTQP